MVCYIEAMSDPDQNSAGSERELFERALELEHGALEQFLRELAETDSALAASGAPARGPADRAATGSPLETGPAASRPSLTVLRDPQHIGPYRVLGAHR